MNQNYPPQDTSGITQILGMPTRPTLTFAEVRSVKRELLAQQRAAFNTGQPVPPEDLLARWPVDPRGDLDAGRILFEDFHHRTGQGEKPDIAEYERRFPEHRNSLAQAAREDDLRRTLGHTCENADACLRLPAVEDELFGFRLQRALGQGAFAQVFLAEQLHLAARPVVLKISAIIGNEPQMLAQLQHTHIVPIYSLHEDHRSGLRAVCMPYFGGTTLSQLMQTLWADGAVPSRGEQLVEALGRLDGPELGRISPTVVLVNGEPSAPVMTPSATCPTVTSAQPSGARKDPPINDQTSLTVLRGLSYVGAVAWIGARLAEALQHAHERGVLHRDIKPSNILVSSEGQPMLLDFNLAHSVFDTKYKATIGGTVAYMAPEHLHALASSDPELANRVNQRADIYSLGMVLHEMLLGCNPFAQNASYAPMRDLVKAMALERSQGLAPRRFAGSIPWSLESIVRKCLEADGARRYQHAEELAEDLRRFLEDRPLRHAPELSWTEQVGKWRRRHPRLTSATSVAIVAAVLLVSIGAAWFAVHERLEAAQARETKQEFEKDTTRALCLINTTTEVQDHLRKGLIECRGGLDRFQVLDREDWQQHPHWLRLERDDRRRLAEDVRELLMLLARAQVQTSDGNKETAVHSALALLDRAEAIDDLPPSPALWRERADYYRRLGASEQAQNARASASLLQPASARDHYLLAILYANEKSAAGYNKAVSELNRALQLNPRHYWSLVQRGICHQELGDHLLAAADFSQCIGLFPEFAWGHFNRGRALDHSGKKAEAILDYGAALERDAQFLPAYVNRGMVRLQFQQWPAALADFQKVHQLGRDDAFVHAGIGMALEGLQRFDEADAAFQIAYRLASVAGDDVQTRLNLSYGFAVSARLPAKAQEAFASVLQKNPQHPQALYGQAMLIAQTLPAGIGFGNRKHEESGKKLELALDLFTRALQTQPNFADARRFRAVLSARRGLWKSAYQDIDWCLMNEPESGATRYSAACVAALTAAQSPDSASAERAAKQALAYLGQAFHLGYGRDKAAGDHDLGAIRSCADFERLLAQK